MKRNNKQLRLITNAVAASANLTDTSGNPTESYHWLHLAAVRREWQQEFWRPQADAFEMPLEEIRRIESQVRRELYP